MTPWKTRYSIGRPRLVIDGGAEQEHVISIEIPDFVNPAQLGGGAESGEIPGDAGSDAFSGSVPARIDHKGDGHPGRIATAKSGHIGG
jgi:hypothetical protein